MSAPLPADGRENAIFVRALRDYTETCEPPQLTPSCPFFRLGNGGPWCLEECMDLLAEHSAPQIEGVEISSGYRAETAPRRARRPLLGASKPFDSAESLLTDRERPLSEWRPASLLGELRDQTAPPLDVAREDLFNRTGVVRRVVERLGELGIDGDHLLGSIYAGGMAQAIVTMTSMPIALALGSDFMELPRELDQVLRDWSGLLTGCDLSARDLFDETRRRGSEWAQSTVREIYCSTPKIAAWLGALPLEELVTWRSPSAVEFAEVDVSRRIEPAASESWIFDRFMHTYLDRWSVESLVLEWKYAHATQIAPCTLEAMRTRFVAADEIAHAIAAKVAADEPMNGSKSMTVSSFVRPALSHLRAGHFGAAAAIFDACRLAAPGDPEAHNNFGFCAIPDDLATALAALERAAELGMQFEHVNVANRTFVLGRLDRSASALEVAERLVSSPNWRCRVGGYLWDWESPEVTTIVWVDDIRVYVASLARSIALATGDAVGATNWTARLAELGVD